MKLSEIIKIASGAYPDGLVIFYHGAPEGSHGDTLAKFISTELTETYARGKDWVQLNSAGHRMRMAARELNAVANALFDASDRAYRKDVLGKKR